MKTFACYYEILKKNGRPCLTRLQTSLVDFFKPSSVTNAWPPVLFGTRDYDPDDPFSSDEILSPSIVIYFNFIFLCIFRKYN
jgi:hypothetical protein